MRAQFNGKTKASQALVVSSILIARSIFGTLRRAFFIFKARFASVFTVAIIARFVLHNTRFVWKLRVFVLFYPYIVTNVAVLYSLQKISIHVSYCYMFVHDSCIKRFQGRFYIKKQLIFKADKNKNGHQCKTWYNVYIKKSEVNNERF